MTRLERAGVITAYAVEGAGPPVLLIHGVGARLDAWDGV
jgi:pimeloyl-ACP methyl ester carboxylesterase